MLTGTATYLDNVAACRVAGRDRAVSLACFGTSRDTLRKVRDWCKAVCLGDPHLGQINLALRARGLPQVPSRVTSLTLDTQPDPKPDQDNDGA